MNRDHQHHLTTPGAALRAGEGAGSKDNLILDIGAGIGALAIHTTADRDGTEIEISPAGDHQARSHNVVHPRTTRSAIRYAAVFPALAAGDYTVWQDQATPQAPSPSTAGRSRNSTSAQPRGSNSALTLLSAGRAGPRRAGPGAPAAR